MNELGVFGCFAAMVRGGSAAKERNGEMGVVRDIRIRSKLASEQGASLSIALFLILICVSVSAVVIAAATTAVGSYVDKGRLDQRYYSVTSAANLFCDSLGANDEVTLSYKQERKGKRRARIDGPSKTQWESKVTFAGATGANDAAGYSFLPGLTSFALFGSGTLAEGATVSNTQEWAVPFSATAWTSASDYADFRFQVGPRSAMGGAAADDLGVTVVARLHKNWDLELDFYNSNAIEAADQYHLYLSLDADVQDDDLVSEALGETTVSGTNEAVVTESRQTTVSWRLKQVVPGRGFSDVAA